MVVFSPIRMTDGVTFISFQRRNQTKARKISNISNLLGRVLQFRHGFLPHHLVRLRLVLMLSRCLCRLLLVVMYPTLSRHKHPHCRRKHYPSSTYLTHVWQPVTRKGAEKKRKRRCPTQQAAAKVEAAQQVLARTQRRTASLLYGHRLCLKVMEQNWGACRRRQRFHLPSGWKWLKSPRGHCSPTCPRRCAMRWRRRPTPYWKKTANQGQVKYLGCHGSVEDLDALICMGSK